MDKKDKSKEFRRYLVTSALPYANGPIHIGHVAGVYLPSDIYVRYRRLREEDVVWVCGSDEHGVPITIRAREEGVTPREVVDRYHELNRKSFSDFGISFDIYSRTSSELHRRVSSDFFTTLYAGGHFVEQESQQYYDPEVGEFLADRYVVGVCPICGFDHAYGDQCEHCGSSLGSTDLLQPHSVLSGAVPEVRLTRHWYLPLERWQGFLEAWLLGEHGGTWKPSVVGQCKSWFDTGLQPRAVSRDLSWGVPVPLEGAGGKVLYVWFDAPIGYITATQELLPDRWEEYWKDEGTKMVHFIGKDNIVFHCIVFPAMLKAHGDYILPDNVPANEFLNLEGRKLSTSGNWAVWLHEYLDEFPGCQDSLRYVLAANMPESKDNDFTWGDFQQRVNSELVGILGNFVNRALVLTRNYYGGVVPDGVLGLTEGDRAVLQRIVEQRARVESALEEFRFRDALREFMNLARVGNKYLADEEPWKVVKRDPGRVESVVYVALQVAGALSILGEPFVPFASARLREYLNFSAQHEKMSWSLLSEGTEYVRPGVQLPEPGLLFRTIEDGEVERQLAKLSHGEAAAQEEAREGIAVAPLKSEISFEDFTKVDLRVGQVLAVERIPKTQKLYKLRVDIGVEVRDIVSGIAEHFEEGDLLGKRVVVVANLAPRRIRGVESCGMLIFAEGPDGGLTLLSPVEGDAPAGSTIG